MEVAYSLWSYGYMQGKHNGQRLRTVDTGERTRKMPDENQINQYLAAEGHGGLSQISGGGPLGRIVVACDGTVWLLSDKDKNNEA